MIPKGTDRLVKAALFESFPNLLGRLRENRCLRAVFPSIQNNEDVSSIRREDIDTVLNGIVYYAPFNATNRTKINGVEFHLYYNNMNCGIRGRDGGCYAVEIVIPSTLENLTLRPDDCSIGTILLEYVLEHVYHLALMRCISYSSMVFEKNHYGYKILFEYKER